MAHLVLGPVLRYVGEDEATVWVETDSSCVVEVLDNREETFEVCDHHYALVCVGGLEAGGEYEYSVEIDGEQVWPEPEDRLPAPVIRTLDPSGPISVVFGSCRVALPHNPPYTLTKDKDESRGRGFDALYALAMRMLDERRERWPDLLLMLGDQVYVDEGSPAVRDFIRSRRDIEQAPGLEVADFEEYTRLYREAWGDPMIRWLLSTVSCAMVIDDHDMADDWKISRSWIEEMRATDWWADRSAGGLMTYWIYQHIGNLRPERLAEHGEYQEVKQAEDGGACLREFVEAVDMGGEGKIWSFERDLGRTRLVVADDRTGRVLEEGDRAILDGPEWDWITDAVSGDFDHIVLGTTDPVLLAPALHYIEAWSEAVCDNRWGKTGAKLGENTRRSLDLDHWPAFGESFQALTGLIRELSNGERGGTPASIGILSGDVHHAYLAEATIPGDGRSTIYQAVCSPFRNALDSRESKMIDFAWSRTGSAIARTVARLAGVRPPEIDWRLVEGPYYDNQFATLVLDGRSATIMLDRAVSDDGKTPRIERCFERRVA